MSYQSVFRQDTFQQQTIIITGGGSGIGRCTAHELASLGAQVILVGRSQDKLDSIVAEIKQDGGLADRFAFDIRDEQAVTENIRAIVEKYGSIQGLVNNAGGQFPAPLEAISQNGFETVVRTNLVGGFLVAREVFKQSMKQAGGAIVNITADNFGGMPMMGHSGAARAGMANFTETAAIEWGAHNVRINAVAPGYIASSGMDTYDQNVIKGIMQKAKDGTPLQRIGNEAEVSSAIVFLLSPAASFITGVNLRVDGGAAQTLCLWPLKNETPQQKEAAFNGFHRATIPDVIKDLL
ncbi:MAG: citronellol/citronellal dehydrogenase [Oleispira sp.]|jgi:citronellol/citronellal dehydrogenase